MFAQHKQHYFLWSKRASQDEPGTQPCWHLHERERNREINDA